MGDTYFQPVEDGPAIILRVDENSSEGEIEEEVDYWMSQVSTLAIEGEHRALILQAVKWMNSL